MPEDGHRSRDRVREVYDRIGSHFSKTREHPWPEVETWLDGRRGATGLDVGCGNGRHTELLAEHVDRVIGVDLSATLLSEARTHLLTHDRKTALVQADAATLPVASDTVDVAVYVATIHHLPNRGTRVRSLDELARVLAPEGRALVGTWSTIHDRFDAPPDAGEGFDTTVDWTLPGGQTVPRFYHIYAPAEFDADLERATLTVERRFESSGNCYAEISP